MTEYDSIRVNGEIFLESGLFFGELPGEPKELRTWPRGSHAALLAG